MTAERELIASNVEAYLRRYQDKELLRFVAVGSVDDGKSTLIGRLLYDTGSVYSDQLESVRKATHGEGMELDLSLLTDGLAAEREQGITIDVAYRYFSTDKRKFIIADTPGHVQYTRNMVTGASTASVAIILVDARLGVLQQSRRHAYIAALLGIPYLAVCVNKMDLVSYDEAAFERVRTEFTAFSRGLSFSEVAFFPISALRGDNCVNRSDKTPFYDGPTVLEFLESVPVRGPRAASAFRFPVQYVLRPNLDYRGFAGRVASGVVRKGDPVLVLSSGKTSRVKAIDTFDGELDHAGEPLSVTLRLEDEVDISRGDMLAHPESLPRVARTFDAHMVWLHEAPLDPTKSYLLKHTTQTVRADVERVHWRKDMDTLAETPATTLSLNDIGRVTVTAHRPLFLDAYAENRETGSFILIDSLSNGTVAAGMVIAADVHARAMTLRSAADGPPKTQVGPRERRARFGTSDGVLLLVGGESRTNSLGYALERRLFDAGASGAVLAHGAPLGNALVLAQAGLLVVAGVDAVSVAAARAQLEGERVLVAWIRGEGDAAAAASDLVVDVIAGAVDSAAETLLAALRERGWLGH
jgi:bifunctional enzyme CysN/CysC/sulfate adenylyltransferase subunit 1